MLGVVGGDYDNDGDLDLYVLSNGSGNRLYRNDGKGRFVDVTSETGAAGDPSLVTPTATFLDYDGDGLLDLFLGHWEASETSYNARPQLLRQVSPGKLVETTADAGIDTMNRSSLSSLSWDYDGDGLPDLYVGADFDFPSLFHNEGGGRFRDATGQQPVAFTGEVTEAMGLDVADWNGDGLLDIYISNSKRKDTPGSGFFVYNGDGTFTSRAGDLGIRADFGWGVGFTDFDNDTWPDIFVGGDEVDHQFLYHNMNGLSFTEEGLPTPHIGHQDCVAAAFADYDNDGRTDILLVRMNGEAPELWHNVTETGNHWLTVRLVGDKRDPTGAVVVVTGRDHPLTRTLLSESSHASQSDRRLPFGLGSSAARVDVSVRWPSGSTDVVNDVAVDREITIAENVGLTDDHPARAAGCAVADGRPRTGGFAFTAGLTILLLAHRRARRRAAELPSS
jgi:hypothetical protein